VHEPRVGSDVFGDVREKRNHVMLHFPRLAAMDFSPAKEPITE